MKVDFRWNSFSILGSFLILFFTAVWASAQEKPEAAEFRIPNSEFTLSANAWEPLEEIEKAADGNPKTHWHSPWKKAGTYPYSIEMKFREPQNVDRIWYLPRQDGGKNGFILQYEVWGQKADGSENWEKLQTGKLPYGAASRFIFLKPGTWSALRLNILEGFGGFGSIAELAVFRTDELLQKASGLFTDGTFSALKTDADGNLPNDLKEKIDALRKETERPDIQKMLQCAETLLTEEGKAAAQKNVLEVLRRPDPAAESEFLQLGFRWSRFQPTGMNVEAGQKFTVCLEADPNEPLPTLLIQDLRTYDWNKVDTLTLQAGWNVLEAPRAGILYVMNPNDEKAQKNAPRIRFENVRLHPFFQLGKTSAEEWKAMMEKENPMEMVELASSRVLLTFSEKNVRKHLDDPQKVLEQFDLLLDTYARLMGYDDSDPNPVHHRPKNLLHLVETERGFMYATWYRTAYHFDAVKPVLNSEEFIQNGWGPWHELGHMHQMDAYEFEGTTEVTVNIFSLTMQTALKQKARTDTEWMREKTTRYFQNPDRNYHAEGDVFMKLGMFWQLRMAFGEDFYPQLHRHYRENPRHFADNEAKVQHFMKTASLISGKNLEPFFNAWGLPMTEETRTEIKKQPPLQKEIWFDFNFSEIQPEGTIGIKECQK